MLNDKKTIHAWCMYDWANSVYSLTITTAIFPIYFNAVAVNASGGDRISFFGAEIVNSVLYSYSLSASFLLVALVLPILSGIADYAGKKKFFLRTTRQTSPWRPTTCSVAWGYASCSCRFEKTERLSTSRVFYGASTASYAETVSSTGE